MRARKKKGTRKVILVVPVVWGVLTTMQAIATADDGGDAGADGGTYQRTGTCSVAGEADPFGNHFGAGCC